MRVLTHCGWGGTINRVPMKAHHPLTAVEPKKKGLEIIQALGVGGGGGS
jgi:hypothetical protein